MRGIAERAEVRIMRSFDAHRPAYAHQPVELLHRLDHVIHVLNDMDRRQPVERPVGEGIGKTIEIGQHVGAAGGIPVEPDRSGLLVNPAADVEYLHPLVAVFRHSSSVSTAKSHWSRVTIRGGHSRIVVSPAPSTSSPRSNAALIT